MGHPPNDSDDRSQEEAWKESEREEAAAPRPSTDWSAWTATLRDVTPYLDLGWRLMGAAAGPPMIGYAVDVGLGTSPWGLLLGGGIGLVGAGVQLVRLKDEFTRPPPSAPQK